MPVGLASLLVLEGVGVGATGLFAGAAFMVNAVSQPAREQMDASTAVKIWRAEFHRVAPMQLSLSLIGSAASIGAWALAGNKRLLLAGASLFSVVPWTLIVMRPTTLKPLLDESKPLPEKESRDLLQLWGRQHAVRTVLSIAALGLAISAVQRGSGRLDWGEIKREVSGSASNAAAAAAKSAAGAAKAAVSAAKSRF